MVWASIIQSYFCWRCQRCDIVYADDEREVRRGYARALRSVVKRLELLGYTISKCKEIYQDLLKETPDWCSRPSISFDVFSRILKRVMLDAFECQMKLTTMILANFL